MARWIMVSAQRAQTEDQVGMRTGPDIPTLNGLSWSFGAVVSDLMKLALDHLGPVTSK